METDSFAAFVLTHGRAGRVKTVRTLRRQGYTGRVVVLIDDEDEEAENYMAEFPEVEVFCKEDYVKSCDTMCPTSDKRRGVILYARNAAQDVARRLGIRYIVELDDDYVDFELRQKTGKKLVVRPANDLDALFAAFVGFLRESGVKTVALSQGGDLIGGAKGQLGKGVMWKRKAMNSFFIDVENPVEFVGAVNEDVNTYTLAGGTGDVFLTYMPTSLVQTQTQKSKGGMSGEYKDDGTWAKTMFSVVARPDCVSVSRMGQTNMRIHHNIDWRACCPKIVRDEFRKGRAGDKA